MSQRDIDLHLNVALLPQIEAPPLDLVDRERERAVANKPEPFREDSDRGALPLV
jgi:hypothetical protein